MRKRKSAKRSTEMERREATGFKEYANRDGGSTYQTLSTVHERVGRNSLRP